MDLLRRKSVTDLQAEALTDHSLKRALGPLNLTMLGIGWDLILEYAVGAIAVSVGWSGYVVSFLKDFGLIIPPELSAARGTHLINLPATLAATLNISPGWQTLSTHLAEQIKAAGSDP